MKKYIVVWGAMFFIVVCVALYLMLEAVQLNVGRLPDPNLDSMAIDNKIKHIQSQIMKNHQVIKEIKDTVKKISAGDKQSLSQLQEILKDVNLDNSLGKDLNSFVRTTQKSGTDQKSGDVVVPDKTKLLPARNGVSLGGNVCLMSEAPISKADIQMPQMFDTLPFDNPDGGAWKQGWDVQYESNKWSAERKLHVYVVPHSHMDPGWVKTFDDYYKQQVREILDTMLSKVSVDPKRKFIEAEMSFFSVWWNQCDEVKKEKVKKLVESGQIELVTGGWVMTDEANAHYTAMVDQLIEGHQWLEGTMGVKPKSGWAIDPFGHSPTMAYILKRSGFDNMLIQRVHYAIKKQLARDKNLEFMWRQQWDQEGSTDILCHMMPFYSYDIPHTCGPDPKICCQFDFARLSPSRYNCPWKIAPVGITQTNVAERASMLLDQYRKKAELYKSDVILLPLGDDFRYDNSEEAEKQFTNYQLLFDYMNSHPEMGVQAQFGTLSDYFSKLFEINKVDKGRKPASYPILSGDFFTYADRDDHYWSGYYTSRPFYKRLDRMLEYHLRSAEVIFSVASAWSRKHGNTNFPVNKLFELLVNARRNLGLYQHHDGITGTAKDFVVVDYCQRMLKALMDSKHIVVESLSYLSQTDNAGYEYLQSDALFDVDETIQSHDSLPVRTVTEVSDTPRNVLFYNSLGQEREQIVKIYVSSPFVEVRDESDKVVLSQTDPFWQGTTSRSTDIFKVSFLVRIPALGFVKYTVKKVSKDATTGNSFSTTTFYNGDLQEDENKFPFTIQKTDPEDFYFENANIKAEFSAATGLLKSVTDKVNGKTHTAAIDFVSYGVKNGREKSGAYLFLPDGPSRPYLVANPVIRITKGPVMSEVNVIFPHVNHHVRVYNSPGPDGQTVDVFNLVDIRKEMNFELAMKITTDIGNQDRDFYTDLNGFQMLKHKTYDKLPLQANVYPMPAQAFIEDDSTRFSVLTAQSLGVACHRKGEIEVMMDRRLNQDDNRGLGQGVRDNKLTPNRFSLLFEQRKKPKPKDKMMAFPSILSHTAYLHLIHPPFVIPQSTRIPKSKLHSSFTAMATNLPCDVHLLNIRTLQNPDDQVAVRFTPRKEVGLLLHRFGTDCGFDSRGLLCSDSEGKVTIGRILRDLEMQKVTETSLTLMHDHEPIDKSVIQTLQPMEIYTYKIRLQ